MKIIVLKQLFTYYNTNTMHDYLVRRYFFLNLLCYYFWNRGIPVSIIRHTKSEWFDLIKITRTCLTNPLLSGNLSQ